LKFSFIVGGGEGMGEGEGVAVTCEVKCSSWSR
jgi:hypothetical protein